MTELAHDIPRKIGEAASKAEEARQRNRFNRAYLAGANVLDIGYRGYLTDVEPIVPHAIGVDLDHPGYDGRTLPFPDNSQDSVFSSHCLEHIVDFNQALRDWFRVVRIGGYVVVMVPHQFLYEKRIALPSLGNADHKRFYTPASLLQDVELALPPNSYRVRHLADNDAQYDYGIPPRRHAGGSYEIELVIEKIALPEWQLERPAGRATGRAPLPPPAPSTHDDASARHAGLPRHDTIAWHPWPLRVTDFGGARSCRRILVLQLGHLGDFVISLPALRRLRAAFPDSHVTLLTGSWNRTQAQSCGLVDAVGSFDFFPEVARDWDGRTFEDVQAFRAAAAGRFDLAIDLRVDLDTRHLLRHVDADLRAGIGPGARFPFLDVALPYDYAQRVYQPVRDMDLVLGPDRFHSRMPRQGAFRHETDFSLTDTHVIYGPYLTLPKGDYQASFDLSFRGSGFGRRPARITLEAAQGAANVLASRVLDGRAIRRGGAGQLDLAFSVRDEALSCEFRVHAAGRPWRAVLGFGGVRVQRVGVPFSARLKPADLHVGELMSLLVQLTADRVAPAGPLSVTDDRDAASDSRNGKPVVAIAPASNSDLRDWPADHYAALVRLLVERLDCAVVLLGSREQAGVTAHVARESRVAHRVTDLAGRTSWADLPGILQRADLVVCNNSGAAHLAASQGARTLAIYSASHQPQEWGPRGPRARAVMAMVPCSPCGLDRLSECAHGHTCMQDLSPDAVFDLARQMLRQPVPAGAAP